MSQPEKAPAVAMTSSFRRMSELLSEPQLMSYPYLKFYYIIV
jgi:hypothetical protein